LDAAGIASLFAGQRDNITAALPSGFGKLLAGTGLLDSLGGATRAATSTLGQTVQAATSVSRGAVDSAQRAAATASSLPANWRYWVIPLLAVVAALIYLYGRSTEQGVKEAAATAQTITVGGVDIGKQVGDGIVSLRTALGSVADPASAQSALPKIQEVSGQIDKVAGMLGQLSPDQRKVLAGVVTPAMPALNQIFDKALGIPGVADVLKPTIDTLRAKLAQLTA
jgi:hypothetical protein